MMKFWKHLILFLIGGTIYLLIEIIWRTFLHSGSTHWTMFVLGGFSFLAVGGINEYFSWDMSLILQSLIGSIIITAGEFLTGTIVNIWLKFNVWDYSNLPFNIMGQICLPFSILWFFVATVAIMLDDYLRYIIFGEEKPQYKII